VAQWNTTLARNTTDTQAKEANATLEKDVPTPPAKIVPVKEPPPTDVTQANAKQPNKTPARNVAKVVATLAALPKPGPRMPDAATKATQPNVNVKPQLKDTPDRELDREPKNVVPLSKQAPPNKLATTRNALPPRHPTKVQLVLLLKAIVTTLLRNTLVVQAKTTLRDQPNVVHVMPPPTVVDSENKMVTAGQVKATNHKKKCKHDHFSFANELECPSSVKVTLYVPQLFEI
jgi:hypothetical protein